MLHHCYRPDNALFPMDVMIFESADKPERRTQYAGHGRGMQRILVVEDDASAHKEFSAALRVEGFDVLSCLNGTEVIEAASSRRPDIIIFDIQFPDNSGFEVCRQLKADAETRSIPLLIVSSDGQDVDGRVTALDLGAEDYLLKPVSFRVLISRIKSILRIFARYS
jgi:DNA-binding response OmpR family regulator